MTAKQEHREPSSDAADQHAGDEAARHAGGQRRRGTGEIIDPRAMQAVVALPDHRRIASGFGTVLPIRSYYASGCPIAYVPTR